MSLYLVVILLSDFNLLKKCQ